MTTAKKQYDLWCKKVTDEALKKELEQLKGNDAAIENAFFKNLEFGTGGLRGDIGVGTNCVNIYTIAKASAGLAKYMLKNNFKAVAISYDSRIKSDLFAQKSAEIMASFGIKAYVSPTLAPTPFLSFMVRELKCDMGIMITASHNPAINNGYKVYDSDGCQITDDAANAILSCINTIDPFSLTHDSFDNYLKKGLACITDTALENSYIKNVLAQSLNFADGLSVVYTPLNGAGYSIIPKVLQGHKLDNLFLVKEQAMPDGNFPTCPFPNPEKPEALNLGIQELKKTGADILIATDPDADRMGVAVKHNGDVVLLSGNEIGVLLADYILSLRKNSGMLVKNPILVKTIVTTELAVNIAKKYNAEIVSLLTGFKYIGEYIKTLENKGEMNRFIFGFEESYGYLAGTYVRDKDAVVASMLASEMAAFYKKQGKTLVDKINEIYKEFGRYSHELLTYKFAGAVGFSKMQKILKDLRNNLPTQIDGIKIKEITDYLTQTKFNLPKANVLKFDLQDGSQFIIRPSGTEPLIKAYLTAASIDGLKTLDKIKNYLKEIFS